MLSLLKVSTARKRVSGALYEQLIARSRAPVFFRDFAVADTIDGRFDVVVLHAWLALGALNKQGFSLAAQGLVDAVFVGFDEAMREQGVGDMGLGRKMRAFADAFFGRVHAYETAGSDREALGVALARNLYRGAAVDARARILAAYALGANAHLAAGLPQRLDFGLLPVMTLP